MTIQSNIARELSLTEMLSEPIVQTVMARDGFTRRDLQALIGVAREGKGVRRRLEDEADCQQRGEITPKG